MGATLPLNGEERQMARTLTMSQRCSARNRSGKQCGAWAVTGGAKCALHLDPELAAKMGSKHGRRKRGF